MSNMRLQTIAVIVAGALLIAACDGGSDNTRAGDGDGVSATGTATSMSGTASEAASTGQQASANDEGIVTVDGTEYTFAVGSCAVVDGRPHMGGDGEASVALSSNSLVVQIKGGTSYSVRNVQVSVADGAVTASGTASNLAAANDLVEVELTAPCE